METNEPQPVPSAEAPAAEQKRNASYGALISIVIILLIVIVGAFYAWGSRIASERIPSPEVQLPAPEATTTPAATTTGVSVEATVTP